MMYEQCVQGVLRRASWPGGTAQNTAARHGTVGRRPRTTEKFVALGIHTIGEIASWPGADLARRFGQHGEDLARGAQGVDTRPIVIERAAKSISQETTFARDVTDRATLERTLREQAGTIAAKLCRDELMGTTVKLTSPLARLHNSDPPTHPSAADRRNRGDR